MIIHIKGVQFSNKGAELMLHAILQQIQQRWPAADIVLDTGKYSPYQCRVAIGAYQKLSFKLNRIDLNSLAYWLPIRVRHWLRDRWGIVVEPDIDMVLDASGFAYGDKWKPRYSTQLAREINGYAKQGKKYCLLPQAFGPFSHARVRKQLAGALPNAAFVAARDETSFNHLLDLQQGKPYQLALYPDFTNLVVGKIPTYFNNGDDTWLLIPNVRMLSATGSKNQWPKSYLELMHQAAAGIRGMGFQVVVLNHGGAEDRELCKEISQRSGNLEIIEESDPILVKGIIGASRGVVCSRFHGCVSALSQRVPCIGTSWSHKYEALFEEYHCQEYLISPSIDTESLVAKLESAMKHCSDSAYVEKVSALKSRVNSMWDQIEALWATSS